VEYGNPIIEVKIDKDAKTLTIKDQGIGMTGEEVEKYQPGCIFPEQRNFLRNIRIRRKMLELSDILVSDFIRLLWWRKKWKS
jgi:HSP90 family molecular chaperone